MLDTLYYNGHTTAVDALWAALPVLTCPGETFASRIGASLLSAVGLPELIAADLTEYDAALSSWRRSPGTAWLRRQAGVEPHRLAAVRHAAPGAQPGAPYLAMWENYAAGREPRSMRIEEGADLNGVAPG